MVFLTRPDKGMALYGLILAVILLYVQDTAAIIEDDSSDVEITEENNRNLVVSQNLSVIAPTASSLLDGQTFIYGASNGQTQLAEVKEINRKLVALNTKIRELAHNLHPLQDGECASIGATLFGDDVQRLTFLLNYLCKDLTLDSQGYLIPEDKAIIWAEAVLDLGSDGVQQVLNDLHNMVLGTSGSLGSQSIINIYTAGKSHADVKCFKEYVLSLEVAGYASWATALNLQEDDEEVNNIIAMAKSNLQEQINYIVSDRMPPRDCEDLRAYWGVSTSGVYTITVNQKSNPTNVDVFCDMDSAGGGWTMLLRRQDGTVDFNVGWYAYKNGFGTSNGELWLGNDNIHSLTMMNGRQYKVRFDLVSNTKGSKMAEYASFAVGDAASKYVVEIKDYSGTAGDSFSTNGMKFTTKDRDNDIWEGNCAQRYTGGWWFSKCHSNMLTGTYGQGLPYASGVTWKSFLGYYDFLNYADMKIKPYQ